MTKSFTDRSNAARAAKAALAHGTAPAAHYEIAKTDDGRFEIKWTDKPVAKPERLMTEPASRKNGEEILSGEERIKLASREAGFAMIDNLQTRREGVAKLKRLGIPQGEIDAAIKHSDHLHKDAERAAAKETKKALTPTEEPEAIAAAWTKDEKQAAKIIAAVKDGREGTFKDARAAIARLTKLGVAVPPADLVAKVKAKRTGNGTKGTRRPRVVLAPGELPTPPDFSAATHKPYRARLEALVKLVDAGDIKGLVAFAINPISTSPKALDRYRNAAVEALKYRAKHKSAA